MIITTASFGALSAAYPRRDVPVAAIYAEVEDVMTRAPGTPCCVQMSRAFGVVGIPIPARSYRRQNETFKANGRKALLAVDEFEDFLTEKFGPGEDVRAGDKGPRSPADIRKYIARRLGLLVFRHAARRVPGPKGTFEHTELWDGTQLWQRDMADDALLASPRVLMWETNDARAWLKDYMGA